MAKDDDGSDAVGEFVEGLVDGMVVRWVLLVQFIDPEDGVPLYYGDSMEGQTAIETLGLGQAIVAIESARVVRNHFDEED